MLYLAEDFYVICVPAVVVETALIVDTLDERLNDEAL